MSSPALLLVLAAASSPPPLPPPPVPHIVGGGTAPHYSGWTSFIGMPDLALGPLGNTSFNSPHMQPVDFAVWQAADGTWQLQSCIRNTCVTGCDADGKALQWDHSRLFYRWESPAVANSSTFPLHGWKDVGVVMLGEAAVGERVGGLQAPHVTKWDSTPPRYHMFYGSWSYICQAISTDGKHFTRVLDGGTGRSTIFGEGEGANTRDPMLFQIPSGPATSSFRIVYSAYPQVNDQPHADGVWSRTISFDHSHSASLSLQSFGAWNQTHGALVGYGGATGSGLSASECPFVHNDAASGYYYLLRTQRYDPNGGQTSVYASRDPTNFGIGVQADAYLVTRLPFCAPELVTLADGRVLAVALNPGLDGFRVAQLHFGMQSVQSYQDPTTAAGFE
jgi:hypothetical protein